MTTDGKVRAIRHPINRDSQGAKEQIELLIQSIRWSATAGRAEGDDHRPSLPSIKSPLQRKLKRALVQPRVANHLPANTRAEYGFEHVLLEPPDDRIMLQQI